MVSKPSAPLLPHLQFHDSLLPITTCHSCFIQKQHRSYSCASSFPVTLGFLLRLSIKQTLNDKFTVLLSIFILAISLAIDLPDLALLSDLETCILLI